MRTDPDHRSAHMLTGTWRVDLPGSDDMPGASGAPAAAGAIDLEVAIPADATVGEVASAIATHTGSTEASGELTLAVQGAALDPQVSAASGAPVNGTTIALCRPVRDAVREPPGAPVTLHDPLGARRLRYGHNVMTDGLAIMVGHSVAVTYGGTGHLTVNGVAVRGNAVLCNGDMLRLGEWTATLTVRGVLRPPPGGGPTRRVPVSRGTWDPHEPDPLELPHPPGQFRVPGFPWLTAMVPLAMAAGAWVATRSLLMVAFMGFSFVYVIASGIESRWETRAADRFAVGEFRDGLTEAADDLQARRASQYERDETHNPSVAEAAGWAHPLSHRLWERGGSHPRPLAVRLGTAPTPPDDLVIRPQRGRPDLREALDEVCAHNDPSPRPVTVDLEITGGIALVGDEIRTRELADSLLAQLALLNPPGELAICLDVDRFTCQWVDWLPHTTTPGNRTVWMCQRNQDSPVGPGPRRDRSPGADSPRIWTAPDTIGLPGSIRALVHFDNHGIATLQIDHGQPEEFDPEILGAESLEFCARRLAGLAPGSEDGSGNDSTPERVTLTSLGLQPDAERILDGWLALGTGTHQDGLSVPLGAVTGGGILVIDLVRDGPHALVAGTTGAGKSELLRTLLLGLATRYPPDRLNMFLVDYKGGAAFGPLADLPHCVGLLTDLRGDGADRTLTALRAELRRRETVLEHHGESDVSNLDQGVRPASLMLVVDEFATLVSEVPNFLDGMLDVAQRGRSLGIHLVLATQRPAGVISDAIRANTSLRIALRLPDVDDSTDVIGSPLAAGLPRERPGRALVRLDHDQLVMTQVAYSGSVPSARPRIRVRPLHAMEPSHQRRPRIDPEHQCHGPDELEALTGAIIDACERAELPEAHQPVPPPLPEVVTSQELAKGTEPGSLCIGLIDHPEHQRRETLQLDLERLGGVLVVGAPSSGVSTTLGAIAEAADRQQGWQVHAIATSGGLGPLAANASVCEVVDASDHEPLRRMLEQLTSTTADTGSPRQARHLVILDGFGAFEQLQEPVNRGWAIEAFLDLAANGRRHGLFVAVSARRRMEVPPSLLHHLGDRIVLRAVDEDEAAMMDGPAELARVDLPAGRAWVRGRWAQIARPSGVTGATPEEPLRLNRDVPLARLHPRKSSGSAQSPDTRPWSLPIGMGAGDLRVASLDLSDTHALVCGSPGSGRTTALETIAMVAESAGSTVLDVPGTGSAEVASRLNDAVQRATREPARHFVVLMEDLDRCGDDPETVGALTALFGDLRKSNLRLVAAGDAMGLLRCYSDPVTRLRSMRTGVLLGADAHDIGDVLHHDLRRRDDIPAAPGRGWLCHRQNASVVQFAHR